MKVENILLARAIRLLKFTGHTLHMSYVVRQLVEQYKFLKVPQTLEEYDDAKGITFAHGKFSSGVRDVVIDSFQVFNNGIVADTREDTDESDKFLDDIIEWSMKALGRVLSSQIVERVYLSNLEISLKTPISNYNPSAQKLSGALSRSLTEYGIKHGPIEMVSVALNFDRTKVPDSILTNFTLQRREGTPFESGLYFSTAPLKTKDHIALLQMIEG